MSGILTDAKGVPYFDNDFQAADLDAWAAALKTWLTTNPGSAVFTTAERDALAGADLWDGRIIWNSTTNALNAYSDGAWTADITTIGSYLALTGGTLTGDLVVDRGVPKVTVGGSSTYGQIDVERDAAGVATAQVGVINFYGNDGGGNRTKYAAVASEQTTVTDGAEDGRLLLSVMSAGAFTEYLRVSGNDAGPRVTTSVLLNGDGTRRIMWGSGSPEGVVTASRGSKYFDNSSGYEYLKKTGSGTNTGWIRTGGFTGAFVYSTANQSIPNNNPTLLTCNVENYDTDGFHDNATNNSRITIPTGLAGKYLVGANVSWDVNATGARQTRLYVNGSMEKEVTENPGNTGAFTQDITGLMNLAAGNYVEVAGLQTSGGALNVISGAGNGVRVHFFAIYLGQS